MLLPRRYVISRLFLGKSRSARDKAIFIAAERGRIQRKRQGASRCYQKNSSEKLDARFERGHARTRNRIFRNSELLPRDGRMVSERSLSSESKRLRPRGWWARAESRAREPLRRSAGPWRRAVF